MPVTPYQRECILVLRRRVMANMPSRHDPEAFHIEKSEIAYELQRLAREPKPRSGK